MRILLLNQVFYPDVAATAQHAHDLARHLAQNGHEVAVIASRSIYGEKGATLAKRETVDGARVYRVGRSLFGKGKGGGAASVAGRLFDFGYFYVAAAFKALTIRRPDVIICFTTPPMIGLIGWLSRLLRGTKYVYWAMDLYPDVLIAGGMLRERSLLARTLEAINRFCMRRADRVVVLGRCMRERVMRKGVDPARLVHIGVWSDHEEIASSSVARGENLYRKQWSVGPRFLVMYSGNFGIVHDVTTMCAAAEHFADDDRIAFAFVGGGKRKPEVDNFVHDRKATLVHAHLEPYQPREKLNELLTAADAHLVSLRPGYEGIVVPSKLFGIMAAGKPAIFIGPRESEVARIIEESDCGFIVEPGDVDGLVRTIETLASDRAASRCMGERGRVALQELHDRRHACAAWQKLLESLVAAPRLVREPSGPVAAEPRGHRDAVS